MSKRLHKAKTYSILFDISYIVVGTPDAADRRQARQNSGPPGKVDDGMQFIYATLEFPILIFSPLVNLFRRLFSLGFWLPFPIVCSFRPVCWTFQLERLSQLRAESAGSHSL